MVNKSDIELKDKKRAENGSTVLRFPRIAESAKELSKRIDNLDTAARHSIARGRAANVETGRYFLQLKRLLGHGKWERHFEDTFRPLGIKSRTARTWMRLARKEKAKVKTAESADFAEAMDQEAVDIRNATIRAEAEVGRQSVAMPKLEFVKSENRCLYQLPLHVTENQKVWIEELRNLQNWPRLEMKILGYLGRLYAEFGRLDHETERRAS